MSNPIFPAIPNPAFTMESLFEVVSALKEAVELLTGQSGNASNTAVTQAALTTQVSGYAQTAVLGSRVDSVFLIAGNAAAAVVTEQTARIAADGVLSSNINTVSTTVGSNTAAIVTNTSSINGIGLKYSVTGNINGSTGGFTLSGVQSNGGGATYTMELDGSLIVTGSITAAKLAVSSLSAITANIGTVTAGVIQSTDGNTVFNLNLGNLIISS